MKIGPKWIPEGPLGGSGHHLDTGGGHLDPRGPPGSKNHRKVSSPTPPRDQFGSQNRRKVDPGALRNGIDFLMGCWAGFWSNFVATLVEIRRKIHSKIDQFWTQNRCRLEHRFESSFGTMFYRISLLVQDNMKWSKARNYCKY